jgi:hypothetical protein
VVTARGDGDVYEAQVFLRGEGVASNVQANPESLDFGPVRVGAARHRSLTLANRSRQRQTIEVGRSSGAGRCGQSAPFPFCLDLSASGFDPEGRVVLAAGDEVTVRVRYAPDALNPVDRGRVTFSACDAPSCEVAVALAGQPVERALACDSALDFGAVNPGASLERAVSCRAVASEAVTISELVVVHDVNGAFEVGALEGGFDLEPAEGGGAGEPREIPVTFSPAAPRAESGQLRIRYAHSTASDIELAIELAGRGGGPDIEVEPQSVDCGLTALLVPSRRTLSVRNVGFDPLTVEDIRPSATDSSVFRVFDRGAEIIPVGGITDVVIECGPTREGPRVGRIEILSDDADERVVGVDVQVEGVAVPPCEYALEGVSPPSRVEFAAIALGHRLSRTIAIRNRSTASPCLVNRAGLARSADPAFSMPEGELTSVLVPPGEARSFRVAYVPTAIGASSGAVELAIASPDEPFRTLPLSGETVEDAALIGPNDVDFGTIEAGARAVPKRIRVFERAPVGLEWVGATLVDGSGAFGITDTSTLPVDEGVRFDVTFEPERASDYAAHVEVTTRLDGRLTTQLVNLEGRAAVAARTTDTFRQLDRDEVDVLFVIDTSGSNTDDQVQMAAAFERFLQLPRDQSFDYHVGVTTTDMFLERGRLVPVDGLFAERVTTEASMPSPEAHFEDNVVQGDNGSGFEQALAGAEAALSASALVGDNRGFRRSAARLALIVQIDEADQSPGSIDFFEAAFTGLVGFRNRDAVVLSSISGGLDGCFGLTVLYDPDPRMWELTQRTGGLQPSCDALRDRNWGPAFEDIADPAFGRRRAFLLSNPPVPSTIRVLVDQVQLPRTQGSRVNWTYDARFNRVDFAETAVPGPGAEIAIGYVVETR